VRRELQEGLADRAMRDPSDPTLAPREQAALEMATLFTLDYQAITDEHVRRWRMVFSEAELIELATFMALADGFGKVVEMLGLGDTAPTGSGEI